MRKEGVIFQLVPPHLHFTNDTERAIHTFKDFFLQPLEAVTQNHPSIFEIGSCHKLRLR